MSSQLDFTGKQVWVTGAGRGIGYETACRFVQAGAEVVGFDRAFSDGAPPFTPCLLDISDADAVAARCAERLSQTPRLDVLVNGAGILRMGAAETLSQQDWQDCLAVNAGGAFNLFQATIPQFQRQRGGAIVTVASNAAHVPRVGMAAYCASKAALRSLCLTVGLELAPYGVRCNVISPGSTDTPMQRTLWHAPESERQTIAGFPEQFKLGIPLGKIARPQEIADAILFMASDLAGHITLQDIVIDGGATLGA
ncbi:MULTISPECIES: 2,3-dihydro-2,3-dihydroxybenzoate dehydrogenase [unclassified Brenneria]|uniref:2,3-dihydro-2,3-dihydroxybenzoate dehydrogenase n=1 Tax=unclassified Brenneria TaxID=2634434 RepID=UPI00155211DC|nr:MULTISPECIES: 2,3-dihydro-2,3-dihydroxybenzoate dehydrogenase [unclassified Brenneria]MBJ7222341.1 2,3-dihydro-2,3-dihydroxybenzoate dehydrogenase [Brenneria sp. L3-3C-1]MEE3643584.1 2,3-dihydro-2,3-dihydroxybenzoate dehydrogenase [Brenneria sp. L3_3C_1]MEE3651294.1 2,3-dihydro-2,3-dihydroxybenzoate dehydrogenase [Brenneria sp. HEZEL_4_2_4]NPD01249.1 2,3-dihydro-2,3-dihydroxybenzoate dehydrogenase [Brenneria sp. hezel4-2-4]